jgi:hypothetical protein
MWIAVKLKPCNGSQHLCQKGLLRWCKGVIFGRQRQPVVPSIHVKITPEQLAWVESQVRPFFNKSAVIRDLIDSTIQGVDSDAKLSAYHVGAGRPQGNSRPLTGTQPSLEQPLGDAGALQIQQSLPQPTTVDSVPAKEIEDEKKHIVVKNDIKVEKARKSRAKRAKGTPEFEAFWKRYQGCRHRANGQSKPKALELWGQLVPDELQADDLMRAIDGAIKDIHSRQDVGEFASPLPDCFRWLRDGFYSSYLEENTPEQRKPSWML